MFVVWGLFAPKQHLFFSVVDTANWMVVPRCWNHSDIHPAADDEVCFWYSYVCVVVLEHIWYIRKERTWKLGRWLLFFLSTTTWSSSLYAHTHVKIGIMHAHMCICGEMECCMFKIFQIFLWVSSPPLLHNFPLLIFHIYRSLNFRKKK